LSPILVRPVREQLEHDRVIRLLQAKYKRKFEVGINPGNQQAVPVGTGPAAWYPDLVLQSTDRSRKLQGVVEVETAESVNNLEAMSQWVSFSKLRTPFHLYVPQSMIDPARRLCVDLQISVSEIWMYHMLGDQMRFTLVQRSPSSDIKPSRPAAAAARPVAARPATATAKSRSGSIGRAEPAARTTRGSAARPVRRAAPAASRKVKVAAKSKASRVVARKKTSGSSRPQKRK
jgi:hypothetical protein